MTGTVRWFCDPAQFTACPSFVGTEAQELADYDTAVVICRKYGQPFVSWLARAQALRRFVFDRRYPGVLVPMSSDDHVALKGFMPQNAICLDQGTEIEPKPQYSQDFWPYILLLGQLFATIIVYRNIGEEEMVVGRYADRGEFRFVLIASRFVGEPLTFAQMREQAAAR